ncbi:MAG TPA: alkaline phosphatase family protein [Candidatus Acidoferrales bacterium]|nr:alkaline phosphatase family protein [Candidatus Acidoferrales bacterium]
MTRCWPALVAVLTFVALGGCGGAVAPSSSSQAPACAFHAGAVPADTLPAGTPHGVAIPIDHIVVVMQENHSFDNYFGRLTAFGHPDVDGLPADASNPDSNGTAVPAFHQDQYCTADTDHSWTGSHLEFDAGRNDGFVTQNNPDGARAIGYYDERDLPFSYALATTFAIGDRYFCSVLGPTFPNRFYLLAGTSFGHIRNDIAGGGFSQPAIFDTLSAYNVSWKVYYNDLSYAGLFFHLKSRVNLVHFANFLSDAAAGTLPQVSYVDAAMGIGGTELDEHPPANIQEGQRFAAQAIAAVLSSPAWPHTALFLTYDEHGGFYDHVPPPAACPPDDIAPMLDPSDAESDFPAQFDRYGFRVPMVMVSPYAKPGFVSHTIYDHTSILRFIETRFDLPALTDRDANAAPMLDLFDFSHPALLDPPPLPTVTVDPAQLQQCRADFPQMLY